jgi:subtilase family serine protease
VFVDSDNALDEVTKTNNQKIIAYTPKSCPDFTITGIVFSPTNPVLGTNFTAYVTVCNQGYIAGAGGSLDVWADKTNQPVASATNIGDKYASVLTMAVSSNKTFIFTGLKAGTNAVQREFRAFVDSRGTVQETSETNNQATVIYTPGP